MVAHAEDHPHGRRGTTAGLTRPPRRLAIRGAAFLAAVALPFLDAPVCAGVEPPNVLVIVTDDQPADGTLQVMPSTRSWFGDQGTTYTNAFATTPLCCPSRASIFTGTYAHRHGVTRQVPRGLDHDVTVQARLRDAGYRTGMLGKFLNSWPIRRTPPHFDRWAMFQRGYYDATFNVDGDVRIEPGYATDVLARETEGFLRESEQDDAQPWFLYVATFAPHLWPVAGPGDAPSPVPDAPPRPNVPEPDRSDKPAYVRASRVPSNQPRLLRQAQLETLVAVDRLVRRTARVLEELNEDQHTLAIFLSDNGFLWGDHGLIGKGFPYDGSVRVPLLLRWPGRVTAGIRDDRLAATIDLAPTVYAATGVTPAHPMDGRSLLGPDGRDRLLLEYWSGREDVRPTWFSLRTHRFQYVEHYQGGCQRPTSREYYDLDRDPHQLENLLADGSPGAGVPTEELHRLLADDRRCAGASCP